MGSIRSNLEGSLKPWIRPSVVPSAPRSRGTVGQMLVQTEGWCFFFKALTKKNNKTCPIFTDARFFFFTKLDASSVASCNPNDPCFDWKRPSFEGKSKDTQVTQVPGRYDMMHHFFFAPEKTNRAWKRSASCQTWGIFFCSFLRDFC